MVSWSLSPHEPSAKSEAAIVWTPLSPHPSPVASQARHKMGALNWEAAPRHVVPRGEGVTWSVSRRNRGSWFQGAKIGFGGISSRSLHRPRHPALVPPGQRFEAEVHDAVQFVERNPHLKTGPRRRQTRLPRLLHR